MWIFITTIKTIHWKYRFLCIDSSCCYHIYLIYYLRVDEKRSTFLRRNIVSSKKIEPMFPTSAPVALLQLVTYNACFYYLLSWKFFHSKIVCISDVWKVLLWTNHHSNVVFIYLNCKTLYTWNWRIKNNGRLETKILHIKPICIIVFGLLLHKSNYQVTNLT